MLKCELAYHWQLTLAEVDEIFGGGEIVTWDALRDLAPFGLRGQYVMNAMLQALIANVNRDAEKRPQPYGLNDFLPEWLRYDQRAQEMNVMTAYLDAAWK